MGNPDARAGLDRRAVVAGGAAAALPLGGCDTRDAYEQAVAATWRHPERPAEAPAALRAIVRYATLAPSSHNTQCWRFAREPAGLRILPDFARRCPVVDPDDHHLFASLGCALENLVEAAAALGYRAEPEPGDLRTDGLAVRLAPARTEASPRFLAIPQRQSTRADYDGRPLATAELARLAAAGTGGGVAVRLFTAPADIERVVEAVVAGHAAQARDAAFVAELVEWIRFNEAEAVATGDGLFARSSGNPTLPRWLGRRLVPWLLRTEGEADRYAGQLRTSAGVAVFVAERPGPRAWVEVGRCFQRFALEATTLGIRQAFLNQPVEVAAIRPQFAAALGLEGYRPDLVVRFGRGPLMPRSLRRPLAAVLA